MNEPLTIDKATPADQKLWCHFCKKGVPPAILKDGSFSFCPDCGSQVDPPLRSLKCDVCGRFIPYRDIEKGMAVRKVITPDAEGTKECYETLCREHVND